MSSRREFITLLGGAAAAWPFAARAQQPDRVRRIGVLAPGSNSDPDQQSRLKVFEDALRELGWTNGRNVRIDIRLTAGSAERFRTYASELVAAKPDVLLGERFRLSHPKQSAATPASARFSMMGDQPAPNHDSRTAGTVRASQFGSRPK
jgi:hypothetical protein